MDPKELAKMSGQDGSERTVAYKLNEMRMSGDTGAFSYLDLLAGKGEDGKYGTKPVGQTFSGVVLKMRWRLFRYDEVGNEAKITTSSEFDNKNIDTIIVFGSNEKGIAADLKEKYALNSQRVLYVFIPAIKEIVRLIVKASALSGDKNPNKELGLFEYVDSFSIANGEYLHEYQTTFGSVERKDEKNPRKNYYAMTFSRGEKVKPESVEKVAEMMQDVFKRTTGTAFAEKYVPPATGEDYPLEDINPDDIPF